MDEQRDAAALTGSGHPIQVMEPAPRLPPLLAARLPGAMPAAAPATETWEIPAWAPLPEVAFAEDPEIAGWQHVLRQHGAAQQSAVAHRQLAHEAFLAMRARALEAMVHRLAAEENPPLAGAAEPAAWDLGALPPPGPDEAFDPPLVRCEHAAFDHPHLAAFAAGKPFACFGRGFELARTHVRSPRPAPGSGFALDEVLRFSPDGGPWGRGELVARLRPPTGSFEEWLADACQQALAFHLSAVGFTLERDAWRFEPFHEAFRAEQRASDVPAFAAAELHLFVRAVRGGAEPTVIADVLCLADGRPVYLAEGLGCRLVADWPLTSRPDLASIRETKQVAQGGGVAFGFPAIIASAWGRPSDAMGERFREFDGVRRCARLPGPPFLFVTRVVEVTGEYGVPKVGASAVVEYDIPRDAWYFTENGTPRMPFAVLLEAALQPCGWLAGYIGCALDVPHDIFFRNLDGRGTVLAEIPPDAGTLRIALKLTRFSKSAGTFILGYDITCSVAGTDVYRLESVFGFFPREALVGQAGLPTTAEADRWFAEPSDFHVDLRSRPARYVGGALRLPGPQLLMLDRVTGFWPNAGRAGLGRLRAEKDVDADEWFFKSHFYQDPVQPGSLGLEALLQLLQFHVIESGLAEGLANPHFEPIAVDVAHGWKYRGQVLPHNRTITTEIEITRVERDARGVLVTADASLRVDGKRVYEATNLGVRVVAGEPAREVVREIVIDPKDHPWVRDHCPTYTVPALPMMTTVEVIAQSAKEAGGGRNVLRIDDLQLKRWAHASGPVRYRTTVRPADDDGSLHVKVEIWRETKVAALSRFEELATATVRVGDEWPAAPEPLPPLEHPFEDESPYVTGHLFHGPSFQVLRRIWMGRSGSTTLLDAATRLVPFGVLQPALLDGTTHGIPHDRLQTWSDEIEPRQVSYPSRVTWMSFHGPTPESGEVRCETRFEGFEGSKRFPVFRIQAFAGDRPWVSYRLVMALFPQGPLVAARGLDRKKFFWEWQPVPGLAMSTFEGGVTRLTRQAYAESDWLAGSVAMAYRLTTEKPLEEAAVKDHVARVADEHPCRVHYDPASNAASCEKWPLTRFPVAVGREADGTVTVRDAGPRSVELAGALPYLRRLVGHVQPRAEALYSQLVRTFVSRVELTAPEATRARGGRSVLYLANHQTQIESILFSTLMTGIHELPVVVLANAKHRERWVGRLYRMGFEGGEDLRLIRYFDQSRPETLPGIVEEVGQELKAGRRSFMVHVEGTRQTSCRDEVSKLSSLFLDLALNARIPIVPVRFTRGLPVEPLTDGKLEVPVGFGAQEYLVGAPIGPEELEALPLARRRDRVLAAINGLGRPASEEQPSLPRPELAEAVARRVRESGLGPVPALFSLLAGESAAEWADWGSGEG